MEYPRIFPIFKTACVAKMISRIINTIASIWGKNVLGYLSLDVVCSLKFAFSLELRAWKAIRFLEQLMSAERYPSNFSRQMEVIVHMFPSLAGTIRSRDGFRPMARANFDGL